MAPPVGLFLQPRADFANALLAPSRKEAEHGPKTDNQALMCDDV